MFRFTIRDVMWLTTLAAVLVAWRLDRSRLEQERLELVLQTIRWSPAN